MRLIGAGGTDLLVELPRGAVAITRCWRLFAGGAAGQAGAVLKLLQAFAWVRCWILGAIKVDQVVLLAIGAGGCEGLLVKGLPGSRSGADPACWRAPNG
ncbi:hypothetical protein KCX70_23130 (plasmid) [Stutzerimonas stutzeri]|uniref:hypothetical protein n=1 Tax=Stutzerimonas stutzeri TaxID=316 RepID=UPI001BAEE593|nr:hypothetical protein [Stutzerimonas stutzeri]QUE78383.1 hypothetical protein KCX70_23130 [Stutzerimonas stutzeri]